MSRENIKTLFENNILGHLATVNSDGSPWSTPLHVVADDTAIYWFSSDDAVHSRNIVRENRVSFSLFSPDESQGPTGVFINGTAERIADDDRQKVVELYTKRAGSMPPSFANFAAYKVAIGEFDEAKSAGRCWYFDGDK